jgi:hypothetical protein
MAIFEVNLEVSDGNGEKMTLRFTENNTYLMDGKLIVKLNVEETLVNGKNN